MTGGEKKILLVDDNASYAEILSMNLESAGYRVQVVEDGLEALNRARQMHPDLILLDLMLPHLNGHKVCKLLKMDKTLQSIPVIMITSRDTREDRTVALQAGADGFLAKPVDSENVLHTLSRYLAPSEPDNT